MEVTITVMKAMAVMPIAMPGDTEHAVNRTDGSADSRSDRTAHHGANRAGRAAALSRTLLGTADDALGAPDRRGRSQSQGKRRSSKIKPLGEAGRQRQCPDIRFHFNFLC
jgi:hypothetical protein